MFTIRGEMKYRARNYGSPYYDHRMYVRPSLGLNAAHRVQSLRYCELRGIYWLRSLQSSRRILTFERNIRLHFQVRYQNLNLKRSAL